VKARIVTLTASAAWLAAGLLLAGCERPPVHSTQGGYRGVAMGSTSNPRTQAVLHEANTVPPPQPAASPDGPTAGSIYKNVQVLGDLSAGEFARTMLAITEWVAPKDQSCAYCHGAGGDLASDSLYTKVVSRRMLQMVREINSSKWKEHVGATGVTCYTCHRGNPVPSYVWFNDPGQPHASLMAGNRAGQNAPSTTVGLTALPNDPYGRFLGGGAASAIRVVSTHPLPEKGAGASVKDTEATYGLMVAMSESLGVNCTFCHNSRAFSDWTTSTPQRVTAWHGLQMVRALNGNYLEPLASTFPANRLGPLGDGPKLDCATCHQGVNKPLFGQSMVADYPALTAHAAPAAVAAPAAP
jgi:photosynthetic reaction center cytochrome c subunit